jgi:hypothetical protein
MALAIAKLHLENIVRKNLDNGPDLPASELKRRLVFK